MDFPSLLSDLFVDFINPKKRVFAGYLFLSFLIAFVWLIAVRRTHYRTALLRVFDRNVFFSKSAKIDYKLFVINRAFTFFISPLLVTQLIIATAIYYALHRQNIVSSGALNDISKPTVIALFSFAMFLMDDLTKYFVHRWMHHWPILWAFHKIHHSAETMTPITVYRVHPAEGILYGLRSAAAQGVVLSTFIFTFGNIVDLYTVLGVNIIVFIFHITGSNLRHSHINISYWPWLERLLISPAQHQLHHSIAEEHYDKNFGAALAVWDWLFGSLHLSEDSEDVTFGLSENQRAPKSLWDLYIGPFTDITLMIKRFIKPFRGPPL